MSGESISKTLGRLTPAYNEIVKKEIECMLEAGAISQIKSKWNSSIPSLKKKMFSFNFES